MNLGDGAPYPDMVTWTVQNINHAASVNTPPEVGAYWREVNTRDKEE